MFHGNTAVGRSPPTWTASSSSCVRGRERFPFLEGAEIVRLVCHPDAMTPDANPLLGPVPGVRGLWMAAGLSLNGFGGAGGIGKALAGWIGRRRAGARPFSVPCVAIRTRVHQDAVWSAELACEQYRYYYRLRYPFDHDE